MRLTEDVINKIAVLMQHTKMNGEVNWKDGDEIDVCLGGTFAGDKFISIINRTRSNTTKRWVEFLQIIESFILPPIKTYYQMILTIKTLIYLVGSGS